MKWKVTFDVTGVMSFPLDMLRYDGCWPVTQEDVHQMSQSLELTQRRSAVTENKPFKVTLVSYAHTRDVAKPTEARWLSFSWRVSNVKVERL